MKKLALAVMLLAGSAHAARSVTYSWTEPDLDTWSGCTTAVTSSCILGFNLYNVTSGRSLVNQTIVPTPAGANGSTVIDYISSAAMPLGSLSVVATAVYLDNTGAQLESVDSLPFTGVIKVNPPATLSFIAK